MTIIVPLQRHQGMIDMYASGTSYKATACEFHVGEHSLKDMIYKYEPGIIRTRSEQANLSANTNRAFCLADLDQVSIKKPCLKCRTPVVGPIENGTAAITCGLCVAWIARVAWMKVKSGGNTLTTNRTRRKSPVCSTKEGSS